MKIKIYSLQIGLGIICILFALLCGTLGSYNIHLNKLLNFVNETSNDFSDLQNNNISKGENILIQTSFVSYINLGVLNVEMNFYNFILGNILILLFGLNFLFQGLRNKS